MRPVLKVLAVPVVFAHYVRISWWLGHTLRSERIDIAHAFLPHSYVYETFACMLMRPRAGRVMSRLSLNFYKDEQRLLAWLERNVAHRSVDIAIGNSTLILEELVAEGVEPGKLRLLYNGIDPEPFRLDERAVAESRSRFGLPPDAFVMACVGNLHTYKGHADLIRACDSVCLGLPARWALLIAGRDQESNRARLERLIGELELSGRVRLLGEIDDVPALLAASDLFCHPSHHEGMPNAIIEAMAAALPVVATDVGGIPEVVVDAKEGESFTGWLVPPRQPEELGRAILEAVSARDRLPEVGARGRLRVQELFTLERSVARYESIYEELARGAAL